ncbi:hypothetical protein [Cryobacterium ruanii]|uniref:Uncharacterized protein n=1 Tax=Cryobacterium ruanii TaxID=1259197 RepID=A0A4R9AQ00_9MICO|nr:hypothetical protein [Cryobacterium ruanii]TFD66921.1 hypothetical protein E3T47_07100 [Cryobacterium ruanii]
MQPADPAGPAVPDDLDEATRIVRRGEPRRGAVAPVPAASSESDVPDATDAPDDDTVIVQRADDEPTRIAQRTSDEHTRIVARRPRGAAFEVDSAGAGAQADDDEATVRSTRNSTTTDTLLSGRRASAPAHTPVVDALQHRYEPPQVQSGASVRYAARPTPVFVEPKAQLPVADVRPDLARLRLADAAAEIRDRAVAVKRRRRCFTLAAIVSITALVVLAAAYTVFTLLTW